MASGEKSRTQCPEYFMVPQLKADFDIKQFTMFCLQKTFSFWQGVLLLQDQCKMHSIENKYSHIYWTKYCSEQHVNF